MRFFGILAASTAMLAVPALAQAEDNSARQVIEAAIAAHGGDVWLDPGTLVMSGHATFYAPDKAEPVSTTDDYRMWRTINTDRKQAHGAEGKVRIRAASGERLVFEVGFDGETTWNQNGIVPKDEADKFWASNFGFGIIRRALDEGFTLEAAPARDIEGHELDLVRIVDPGGAKTLFGIDRDSRFIRYMAFNSPRGLHERIYDDFVKYPDSGWVQAREVTLYYDGVRNNTVYWTDVKVGAQIPEETYAPPPADR